MELNKDFFLAYWKTFSKKSINVKKRLEKAVFEFLGRLPSVPDMRVWLRENAFWRKSKQFFSDLYARLIVRGEYTRRDLTVLFVAAFVVGVGCKTVATQTVTIGFEDYTLPSKGTLLDLNAVQKKMIEENGSAFIGNDAARGDACSQ